MRDIHNNAKDLRKVFYTDPELNEEYEFPGFYTKQEKEVLNLEYELVYNLIKLRKEKGLSQKKLADLADIDQPSIARIESGKHLPSLKMLIKLLNVMEYKIKFVKGK